MYNYRRLQQQKTASFTLQQSVTENKTQTMLKCNCGANRRGMTCGKKNNRQMGTTTSSSTKHVQQDKTSTSFPITMLFYFIVKLQRLVQLIHILHKLQVKRWPERTSLKHARDSSSS